MVEIHDGHLSRRAPNDQIPAIPPCYRGRLHVPLWEAEDQIPSDSVPNPGWSGVIVCGPIDEIEINAIRRFAVRGKGEYSPPKVPPRASSK